MRTDGTAWARGGEDSPGNLSDYVRNNEEDIRAFCDELRPAWEGAMALPADRAPAASDNHRILEANARIVLAYRFSYRKRPALVRRDPGLHHAYLEVPGAGLTRTSRG